MCGSDLQNKQVIMDPQEMTVRGIIIFSREVFVVFSVFFSLFSPCKIVLQLVVIFIILLIVGYFINKSRVRSESNQH